MKQERDLRPTLWTDPLGVQWNLIPGQVPNVRDRHNPFLILVRRTDEGKIERTLIGVRNFQEINRGRAEKELCKRNGLLEEGKVVVLQDVRDAFARSTDYPIA